MKKLTLVLLLFSVGWGSGCATPPAEGEAAEAGDPARLEMRAPAPAAALRPRAGDPEAVLPVAPGERPPVVFSPPNRAYRLKKSDPVVINFQGIPTPFSVEDVVDENGKITLPYIGVLTAEGRTSSELEQQIFDLYVPDYYRYMNVNVLMPTQRSYFVQGAVRAPGKYPYSAGITLLQALTTAGGYNDFAQPKRVKVLREGQTTDYNMLEIQETPEMDVTVEPGDVIIVPEKWY